jgi:hypothetical protein
LTGPAGARSLPIRAHARKRGRCFLEEKLQRLLQGLGEALIEAISDSSDINDSLRELQKAGYSLYLVVDCKRGAVRRRRSDSTRAASAQPGAEALNGKPAPVFRIDGNDLLFLRSIGIDPTRKSRVRRGKP